MKKSKLEEYLNKQVSIKLFDGETLIGTLYKAEEERFKNISHLYLKKGYYFIDCGCCDNSNYNKPLELLISCLFRSSHVKSLKSME